MARPVGHDSPSIFAALQWSSASPRQFCDTLTIMCCSFDGWTSLIWFKLTWSSLISENKRLICICAHKVIWYIGSYLWAWYEDKIVLTRWLQITAEFWDRVATATTWTTSDVKETDNIYRKFLDAFNWSEYLNAVACRWWGPSYVMHVHRFVNKWPEHTCMIWISESPVAWCLVHTSYLRKTSATRIYLQEPNESSRATGLWQIIVAMCEIS